MERKDINKEYLSTIKIMAKETRELNMLNIKFENEHNKLEEWLKEIKEQVRWF